MRKFLTAIAIILGLAGHLPAAAAENPFAVARSVNQSIISNYEVDQRRRMMQSLGAGAVGRAEALESLTSDRLRLQAAEAAGLTLTEEQMEMGLKAFAEQRQLTPEAIRGRLRAAGVAPESLDDFLKAQVLWQNLVVLRFRDRATPSETDLQAALEAAAIRAQESVRLREIALPFAEHGAEGTRALARRLMERVRGGASFAALAREYSRTPSAPNGGDLGWRAVNRLPPQLAQQVAALLPGEMAEPIEVPAGIIILQLADIREDDTAARPDVSATWIRIVLTAEQATEAATLAAGLESCSDARVLATKGAEGSGEFGPVPLPEIPADIALVLAGLDADEVAVAGNGTPEIVYLCARAVQADPEQAEALKNQLFGRRMNQYAEGYLAELRADAIITDK